MKHRVLDLQDDARCHGEKQLKHFPRRSTGTGLGGRRSARRTARRDLRQTAVTHPSVSGTVAGDRRWRGASRTTIRGPEPRGLDRGVDLGDCGDARAAMPRRSASLKDIGVAPPDFPVGGESRTQRWALLRPRRSGVPRAGEVVRVAAGLGGSVGERSGRRVRGGLRGEARYGKCHVCRVP